MTVDLPRLAGRVFNTPLMFHRRQLDTVLQVIGPRIIHGLEIDAKLVGAMDGRRGRDASVSTGRQFRYGGYMADNGIAVLPVLGTLARRGSFLDTMCGMTSYEMLADAATDIFNDPSVRGVMGEFDTPGGEAGGCFDLSRLFRDLSEATGKPFWAHSNELMASAGYALGSAADQLWVATTGEVGSIGVLAAHVDISEAERKAGVAWTYIFAGETKADGNMHEPLSDRAFETIQADVDDLMDMFVELVSQNRGIDAEIIRGTEANVYRGHKAVESGLADEVGTFDEALLAFAQSIDETQTPSGRSMSAVRNSIMASRRNAAPAPAAETAPVIPGDGNTVAENGDGTGEGNGAGDTVIEPEAPESPAPAPAAPDAAAIERNRSAGLASLIPQASKLGVSFDLSKAITEGTSVDAARAAILDKAASSDEAATTVTAHQPKGAAADGVVDRKAIWGTAMKKARR